MNIEALCQSYLTGYASHKKPRSQAEDARQIKAYILPALGGMDAAKLSYTDVERLHASMKESPYQANRVVSLLSKIMSLAILQGLRPAPNPCAWVRRYAEQKRVRYMSEGEAKRVSSALSALEGQFPLEVAYFKVLLMTGARPEEIMRAERSWITDGVLRLPDSKTGARPVYLPPEVTRLLDALPRTAERLFAGIKPRAVWGRLRKLADVQGLRIYDLRHEWASVAVSSGYSLTEIGLVLGHKSTQTSARYAHLLPSKAREVVAGAAAKIEERMGWA